MDLGLKGKVALVGGASKGLGLAVARSLAREGAAVVMAARSTDVLDKAAQETARDTGAEVLAQAADLSDAEQARGLAKAALQRFGRVDILVNNAGGPPSGQFLDFSDADWEAAYRTNLMSAVVLSREVVPGMKERKWGRIINLTSIAVKQPLDGLILSNAVRAGVHGWAKSLANELGPYNITVNNVLPGWTLTDRVRSLVQTRAEKENRTPEDILEETSRVIPMQRLGRPEDLGDLTAFLASEQAGYITGVSIPIDGGFYKGLM